MEDLLLLVTNNTISNHLTATEQFMFKAIVPNSYISDKYWRNKIKISTVDNYPYTTSIYWSAIIEALPSTA
jgi:hypothetical protein